MMVLKTRTPPSPGLLSPRLFRARRHGRTRRSPTNPALGPSDRVTCRGASRMRDCRRSPADSQDDRGPFMRRLAAPIFLALLTACTSISYDFADLAPPATTTAGKLRFADSNPHDWQDRAPWNHEIHGIDVAKYQGEIDWARVAASGISFAFVKATEGGDM